MKKDHCSWCRKPTEHRAIVGSHKIEMICGRCGSSPRIFWGYREINELLDQIKELEKLLQEHQTRSCKCQKKIPAEEYTPQYPDANGKYYYPDGEEFDYTP